VLWPWFVVSLTAFGSRKRAQTSALFEAPARGPSKEHSPRPEGRVRLAAFGRRILLDFEEAVATATPNNYIFSLLIGLVERLSSIASFVNNHREIATGKCTNNDSEIGRQAGPKEKF
jgi:hypothetical protein